MTAITPSRSWYSDLLLLTLSIVLLFGLFLGDRPLSVPDEARYSEIPREMVVSQDYITPHLNGLKYFEKPVLFYWMQAGAIKLFGLSEWSMRFTNAFMALLGCLLIYCAGRILFDRRTGLIAGIILATNLLYFAMAHMVTLDMTVSVFITASLLFFLKGIQQTSLYKRRLLLYGFYSFAALAVLTKGLIGIIFPAMIIGTWIILFNEWRLLKSIYLPSGILLFLLIATPWHVLAQLQTPEFFDFYFIEQHFLRYATMGAQRYQPAWFWLPILLLGLLPWTVFLIPAIAHYFPRNWWATRSQNKIPFFLLIWAILIFIFFSVSKSKLIPYILPIFPPIALIIAHYLSTYWDKDPQPRGIKIGYALIPIIVSILLGIGLIALNLPTRFFTISDATFAAHLLLQITSCWLPGTLLGILFFWRKRLALAFGFIAISTAMTYILLVKNIPTFDTRSIKPLASILKPLLTPNAEVATYEHYYQDLPFYIERRVTIVEWQGELEFGIKHQPEAKAWIINYQTFWQRWNSAKPVYMLTDAETYQKLKKTTRYKFYFLGQADKTVLIANHQPTK